MIYKFIDAKGTFIVKNLQNYSLYFPLTNKEGSLLSSISPNLAGDIKKDNEHFLTLPASTEDIRSNLLCRREFFIKTGTKTIRLSEAGAKDSLECGFLYQKIKKDAGSLEIEITSFVPFDTGAEVMWVKVKNKTSKTQKITPTSFIPLYGRPERNLRDHRHVSSLLNRIELDTYGIMLTPTMLFDEKGHSKNQTVYFGFGYENEKKAPLGQFPTLDSFYGKGDIIFPDAIREDVKPQNRKYPEFDGKETCLALRFKNTVLRPWAETNYFIVLGIAQNKQKAKAIFAELNSPRKITQSLEATKKYWQRYLEGVDFDFKDENFNNWLLWVKLQPNLRKLFGCSFLPHFDYGKGGRGWRDLWQDALALLINEPQKAKQLILKSFEGVRIDGSNATIITKNNEFIADRNKISRVWMDHGVWPYLTLSSYINKTGDINILLREIPYFRDHQIMRAKEIDKTFARKDYLLRTKNNAIYKGTILEHVLLQNLVQFFNVGKHNIIRLENADWNDGLDMAAKNGESVTFSFMYAHNLKDLCIFLNELKKQTVNIHILKEANILLDSLAKPINYGDARQKQKILNEYLQKTKNISGGKIKISLNDLISDLSKKSEHLCGWLREKEWLKEGFFNGYYDNLGRRVEGKVKGNIRMLLPTQVFAIMSGIAGDTQIKKIWHSIKNHLYDARLAGFRLNTDFGSLYTDLGRAFGFSYGDKENGAVFNHMVVMLAYALYERGFVKEGYEAMNSIYKMAISSASQIYPMIPEYFNAQGRGLYFYLTGSASWYIHTLLEQVLGIKFILGDLYFKPKLLSSNFRDKNIEIKFNFQDKPIRISFIRGAALNRADQIKELYLENKKVIKETNGWYIRKENIKNINKKEITVTVHLG